jgi:hypothetical protein
MGLILGAVGVAVVLLGAYKVALVKTTSPETFSSLSFSLSQCYGLAAVALGVAALVLVCVWASDEYPNEPGFLGKPSWKTNLFAWHPVLMVAGFFVAQVLGAASWNFVKNGVYARNWHIFFQLGGLSTLVAGLWAVWKHKLDGDIPLFTTSHAMVGIACAALYFLNFAWGGLMRVLTIYFPDSPLRRAFDLRFAHKHLGVVAAWMTYAAIATGVVNYMPESSCYYPLSGDEKYNTDAAVTYAKMSYGCRIANGISITVMIASILLILSIMYRKDEPINPGAAVKKTAVSAESAGVASETVTLPLHANVSVDHSASIDKAPSSRAPSVGGSNIPSSGKAYPSRTNGDAL